MRNVRAFLLVLVSMAGCVGNIGDAGDDKNAPAPGTDPGDPRIEARVWRLTPVQYNAELQRFFPGVAAVELPAGSGDHGITNMAATVRIDLGNASLFNEAARSVGSWASNQGASAARCDSFGTSQCVDTFLDWFVEDAYRRKPTADEVAALRGVYDDTVQTYGEAWAFSALVRAVLLSPQFLYRSEIGPSGSKTVVELDDHEIASLLAFSLTDAGPDDELRADARAEKLKSPAVREKHARRLMGRMAPVWQRFFWEWLKMSTLESQGNETELDPVLVKELGDEYQAFVKHIVVDRRGKLKELLTTSHTWGTPEVAAYYGATHPGSGVAEFELDPKQRGGLLTLGAWLVSHGKKGRDNVVRRGMGVYRDAMCNDIAPLNIDLQKALRKLVGADATIKEIAAARSADSTCGACHRTSDPIGLAFETYAGDGTWQTTYADGKPVETKVLVDGKSYDSAMQVSAQLADDPRFVQCLVRRFSQFVMGADYGATDGVRASREAYEAFRDSSGSFEELLVAIVRDRAFIERRK